MPPGDHARIEGADETPSRALGRREWLGTLGMLGIGGLAGCSQSEPGRETGTPTRTSTDTPEPTPTRVEGFGEETETETEEPSSEALPAVGGTYRSAISGDITTLNAMYNSEATAGGLISTAIHGAYTFRPGQRLFPLLFDLRSDDNQVWVAELRDNLRWSDPYGEVTAEDYVYMIQELHQTDWAATAAASDWVQDGEPIPVTETGTLEWQIELPDPDPLFPKKPVAWGMQVVPKGLIEPYVQEQDAEGLRQDEELLSLSYTGNLGPYDLDSWNRQSRLTYSRSEDYFMRELAEREGSGVPRRWAEAPYFDSTVTQIITEPSARVGALETGEIDEVGLEPSQAVNLQDTEGLYINEAPQPFNTPVFYNMRANGWTPFRRQGVRQAFGCAVDKPTYVRGVLREFGAPQYTWQPQWSPYYTRRVQDNVPRYGDPNGDLYGPEVTREKMSEALSDTELEYDGDTLVDGSGEQVELRMLYQAGQAVEESTAEFFKQEVERNAGIRINIEAVQPNTFVTDYWRQQMPENADELEWSRGPNNAGPRDVATSAKPWDIGLIYGLNTYPMTPSSAEVFFTRDAAFNAYGYYPEWNAKETFRQMDEATTLDAYREAVETYLIEIAEDQPMGMLSLGAGLTGYRSNVVGPQEEFFNGWDGPTWYKE